MEKEYSQNRSNFSYTFHLTKRPAVTNKLTTELFSLSINAKYNYQHHYGYKNKAVSLGSLMQQTTMPSIFNP
jgi:hypothetical protein